ncbi:4413_t:CDS:2, partial [Ambispora leptoticha]
TNLSRTYKENLSSDFSLSPKIELDVSENKDGMAETQVKISNKTRLYQYAIEHKMDPEEFSIITEAEKNRSG